MADDFWLLGDFTQNVPCKGDGSDPAELKVKISTDQIDSKVGVCKFLDAKPDGKRVNTHVECQFPAGPLMGDITFTQKPNNTIDFVDRDKTYTRDALSLPEVTRRANVAEICRSQAGIDARMAGRRGGGRHASLRRRCRGAGGRAACDAVLCGHVERQDGDVQVRRR